MLFRQLIPILKSTNRQEKNGRNDYVCEELKYWARIVLSRGQRYHGENSKSSLYVFLRTQLRCVPRVQVHGFLQGEKPWGQLGKHGCIA